MSNTIPHESAHKHVTGRAVYVDDMAVGSQLLYGRAVYSIDYEIKPYLARVYSAMPKARAVAIEEGRPAHSPEIIETFLPSFRDADLSAPAFITAGQIYRWKKKVGYPGTLRQLMREIERSGVAGKRFMGKAREKIEGELPRLLNKMSRRVEEKFGR